MLSIHLTKNGHLFGLRLTYKNDDIRLTKVDPLMPFVLSDHFVIQLSALRKNYEKETALDLTHTPQPYSISLFFGAKDIESRHRQISFIEQWIIVLRKNLSEINPFDSLEAMQHHVTALRLLVAVGLYVHSQIEGTYSIRSGATAVLVRLIHEAIGISRDNMMDDETKACCLLAAKRSLTEGAARLETLNAGAAVAITEKHWHDFTSFITIQCDGLDKKYLSDYPITTMMMPLFAKPMEFAGYATGFVMGDMIGKSTELLPARHALTAIVGSCVFAILGPTSTVGAMLFAGRVLDTFCGISLAWIMGNALNLVGKGVGFGVGMSLDLSWKLLYNATTLLRTLYHTNPKHSGISLIDGHRITDGVEFKLEDLAPFAETPLTADTEKPIELKVDDLGFTITMNGQRATFPWVEIKKRELDELQRVFVNESKLSELSLTSNKA